MKETKASLAKEIGRLTSRVDELGLENQKLTSEKMTSMIEKCFDDEVVGKELKAMFDVFQILDKLKDDQKKKRVIEFIHDKIPHPFGKSDTFTFGNFRIFILWQNSSCHAESR